MPKAILTQLLAVAVSSLLPCAEAFAAGTTFFDTGDFLTPAQERALLIAEEERKRLAYVRTLRSTKSAVVVKARPSAFDSGVVTVVIDGERQDFVGRKTPREDGGFHWFGYDAKNSLLRLSGSNEGLVGYINRGARTFRISSIEGSPAHYLLQEIDARQQQGDSVLDPNDYPPPAPIPPQRPAEGTSAR